MIQGPVIGGPVASPPSWNANAGTPFAVSGPVPTQGAGNDQRVQSARVWAILLGVFAVACAAVVVVMFMKMKEPAPEQVAAAPAPAPVAKPVERKARDEDTGSPPPAQQQQAAPKPRPRVASAGGAPAAPAAPRPPPLGAKAPLTVVFNGTAPAAVEVTCPSGFRDRASVAGGTATVRDVPTGENCTMYPKGIPATAAPARGGRTINCTIQGTTTSCK
jgi:hypothetical protein